VDLELEPTGKKVPKHRNMHSKPFPGKNNYGRKER
jgi:hypothetical protein